MASVTSVPSNAERLRRRPRPKKVHRVQDDEDDPLPGEKEEAPPVRVRDIFGGLFHQQEGESVDVEHYVHEKSFRSRLNLLTLRNSKIGIRLRLARSFVLLLGCILYVVEGTYFDYFQVTGFFVNESANLSFAELMREQITALVLLSDKPWWLWGLQVFLSFLVFVNVCFKLYVNTTWSWKNILDTNTVIMILIPVFFWITVLFPPLLKDLFIPLFLLCWPCSETLLAATIQLMQRSSIGSRPNQFRVKVVSLAIFMACFIYTWVCVIHHFARIDNHLTLFDTLWFLMVTLTTVGYGDIFPTHWTGRLLVIAFILSALVLFLPLVEQLYESFQMQQRLNNSVSNAQTGKCHIVICSTELKPLVLRDLLTEFYSDPSNYEVHCVVLVEKELGHISQLYLSHPVWSRRITVLIGTPMRPADLARARTQSAIACFIHTPRHTADPKAADRYTILCAWAIKDYAPDCKLFVQILQPESKLQLEVADHVVCEGELKCALLANNSHCPGIVTLVTLLLHTFKPEKRNFSGDDYKLYSECSACEMYDIRLGDSTFFHHFAGKNFLYSAVVAYRRYHVTLFAVKSANEKEMKLNPGVNHIMHEDDICYYIGFTKEEYSKVREREAPAIHNALCQACAGAAVMAMSTSGIDPLLLTSRKESRNGLDSTPAKSEERVSRRNPAFFSGENLAEQSGVPQENSASSLLNLPSSTSQQGSVGDGSPQGGGGGGGGGWGGARRGLQLLQFHSRVKTGAKPVIKVNVANRSTSQSALAPVCPGSPRDDGDQSPLLQGSAVLLDPTGVETVIDLSEGHEISEVKYAEADNRGSASTPLKKAPAPLYSSDLSLLTPATHPLPAKKPEAVVVSQDGHSAKHQRPSWRSVAMRATEAEMTKQEESGEQRTHQTQGWLAVIRKATSQRAGGGRDKLAKREKKDQDEVVLELEDLAEEEELEELEDGHCGKGLSGNEERSSPDSVTNQESQYKYGLLPVSPYCGFEQALCYLLKTKRTLDQLKFQQQESSEVSNDQTEGSEDSVSQWKHEAVIAYCEECSDELYHFILPLRAHHLSSKSLKPLIIMFPSEPTEQFLEAISWLPMVYYTVGDVSNVSDWLKAGIQLADSVVVFSPGHTGDSTDHPEHVVDAATIMAVKMLSKLFPRVSILSEITYRYNLRFMRFTAHDIYAIRNLASIERRTDHLTYLFVPQFVSGRTFCTSMLDTLLLQTYDKPYLVDLVRQLLGCRQVQGSGFLWKVHMTEELLQLHTYDRLFQRLASTHQEVPLGIYRTVPVGTCPELTKIYHRDAHDDGARVNQFLKSRAMSLGLKAVAPVNLEVQGQAFVLINPPPKTELRANDIILVVKCAATGKSTPANVNTNNNTPATCTQPPPPDVGSAAPPPEQYHSPPLPPTFTVPVECYV